MLLAMFFNTAIDQQLEKVSREHRRQPDDAEAAKIRAWTLETVRGTVQADILKEDQGQKTLYLLDGIRAEDDGRHPGIFRAPQGEELLFGVDLRLSHRRSRGQPDLRSLPSRSPNGFTFVESYLARDMKVDDFAPNLSFFFSNGMDPEYSVIGGWRGASGRSPCASKYGPRTLAEAEISHPDVRPLACTRKRWISTISARRCRR